MKLLTHPIILSVFLLCFCAGAFFIGHAALSYATFQSAENFCVLLDAGHGGNDPGKIGVDDSREKDLNLVIADKVKRILEQQDIDVIMTRETDTGLYEEDASNKKVQDLKKRVSIINENQPDCVISIHQNSYHEKNVFGAQVFYYKTSIEGEKAAAVIQEALQEVNPENTKKIKANDTYYLLKKTEVPTVIVECGFLSNYAEAEKLVSEDYQKKVAEAVTKGILQYLKDQ